VSDIDPEIPRRAKRGDRQAFAQLVDHFYPRGLRFAQQMLGNPQDAEEALQDTFMRVYDNLSKFREDARFEPWLFRILANRCRTLAAKQQRHHAVIEYGDVPLDAAASGDTRDEWTAEVYGALERLPAEQREAFLLRHVEGMDYDDMAIVTGANLSTLRMRVKRASDALRARLREVELYG
jgi:RNA polymerase sigma-70 factor, ECF subfamily